MIAAVAVGMGTRSRVEGAQGQVAGRCCGAACGGGCSETNGRRVMAGM